jgi:DNA polymerase III delta subunit
VVVPTEELAPAYLIAGTDTAKIDAALARLRSRAEGEGGPGALQVFAPAGGGAPDAEALVAAIPAMSLTAGRRYLLADGVEGWTGKQATPVIDALGSLPPDLTVVLAAREKPPRVRAPKGMSAAVEDAGGKVLSYATPKARALPGWLTKEAARRGLELDSDAARLLVDRMGESTVRLSVELDRLATWAGDDGRVELEDLEAMVADTSEEASWALADSLVDRDAAAALGAAERLAGQGEALTPLIYQAGARTAGQGGRVVARHAPLRCEAARQTSALGKPRRPAGRDLRDGRPRVVDAGRLGLPGGRRGDPCRPQGVKQIIRQVLRSRREPMAGGYAAGI